MNFTVHSIKMTDKQSVLQAGMKEDISISTIAVVINMVSQFVAGILIARFLGPEGKGILVALAVIPSIVIGFADMGLRHAVTYHIGQETWPDKTVIGNLTTLHWISSILCIGIVGVAYFLMNNPAFSWPLVLITLATIPIQLLVEYGDAIAMGRRQIYEYARVACRRLPLVVILTALFVWVLPWGLVGALLASTLPMVMLSIFVLRRFFTWQGYRPLWDRRVLKGVLIMGLAYAAANLVFRSTYQIDILLLERILPANQISEIGQYAIAMTISHLLWRVPHVMGVVVFSHSVAAADPLMQTLKATRLMRLTLLVGFACGLMLAVAAPWVVQFFFGAEFKFAAGLVPIAMPGTVMALIHMILGRDLAGRGRPLTSAFVYGPALVLSFLLNLWWIPKYGAEGAAWAGTLSHSAAGLVFLWVYARVVRLPIKEMFRFTVQDFRFKLTRFHRNVTW